MQQVAQNSSSSSASASRMSPKQHLKQLKQQVSSTSQLATATVSNLIGSQLKSSKERASAKACPEFQIKPIIKTNKPPLPGLVHAKSTTAA